jgi:hypothetical protein
LPNELANKVPFFFLPFDIFKILILNQTCYWFSPFSFRITFRLNKHQIQFLFFRILLWSFDALKFFCPGFKKSYISELKLENLDIVILSLIQCGFHILIWNGKWRQKREIILFKFLFVSPYFLLLFLVLFFGMRINLDVGWIWIYMI